MAKNRIFAETTPLGYRVVLTRDRWREIVRFKHPALAGHEEQVRACVHDPEDYRLFHEIYQERTGTVDKVRVYYDRTGNTLTVWFDDPAKESISEEIDDDVVLMKDRRGRIIGFERLNYRSRRPADQTAGIPVEVQVL